MKRLVFYSAILLPLFILSCKQQDLSPEGALREYVNYAESSNATHEGFIGRSTGTLRANLETMDESEFEDFSKEMDHAKKRRFTINKSNCEELSCFITYTLSYESQSSGEAIYDVEVRKIAELVKEGEQWKVAGIENIKSYYEGSSELTTKDFEKENDGLSPDEVNSLESD